MGRSWTFVLAVMLLSACSGKSGGAPAIQEKTADIVHPMPTQAERTFPEVKAVHNLSPGALGFVAKQITGLSNESGQKLDMAASLAGADLLILNAESHSDDAFDQANAFLREHKQVVVDSNGTPEGRLAVKSAMEHLLGGNAVPADAVLISYFNKTDYSITPLENIPDQTKKNADGSVNGNTALNILSLH